MELEKGTGWYTRACPTRRKLKVVCVSAFMWTETQLRLFARLTRPTHRAVTSSLCSHFWPEHSDFAVTGQPQLCESLEKIWRNDVTGSNLAPSQNFHG